jgi:hypothetical protein
MTVVTLIPEGRKVRPAFLDRTLRLKFRDEKEEKLLNVGWQLAQPLLDLFLDSYLIAHYGNNITS